MSPPSLASRSRRTGLLIAVGLLGANSPATATATATEPEVHLFDSFGGQPRLALPDGDLLGITDQRWVDSSLPRITGLEIGLTISGGFNGDLYVYLRHDAGFSVLLNRPGRSSSLPYGYSDSGLSVTLAGDAANGDIHTYRNLQVPAPGTPLTGRWIPDGREIIPTDTLTLFDSAAPNALLTSFAGLEPRGVWTLFLADVSSGAPHQLESWSLQFVGVPEPAPTLAVTATILLGLGARRLAGAPRC